MVMASITTKSGGNGHYLYSLHELLRQCTALVPSATDVYGPWLVNGGVDAARNQSARPANFGSGPLSYVLAGQCSRREWSNTTRVSNKDFIGFMEEWSGMLHRQGFCFIGTPFLLYVEHYNSILKDKCDTKRKYLQYKPYFISMNGLIY